MRTRAREKFADNMRETAFRLKAEAVAAKARKKIPKKKTVGAN